MSLATIVSQPFVSRTDTYTVAANGVTVATAGTPCRSFALQLTGTTGTATAWSVVLEGSLDGTTFTTIITHVSGTNANGATVVGLSNGPWLYLRTRLVSVTLSPATALVVIFAAAQ
jgi:hypothetical protein